MAQNKNAAQGFLRAIREIRGYTTFANSNLLIDHITHERPNRPFLCAFAFNRASLSIISREKNDFS
jgi:hypothetical protein